MKGVIIREREYDSCYTLPSVGYWAYEKVSSR